MDFDQFRDEAANYLEDAGILYSAQLDERLWELFELGVKPHEVPKLFASAGQTNGAAH